MAHSLRAAHGGDGDCVRRAGSQPESPGSLSATSGAARKPSPLGGSGAVMGRAMALVVVVAWGAAVLAGVAQPAQAVRTTSASSRTSPWFAGGNSDKCAEMQTSKCPTCADYQSFAAKRRCLCECGSKHSATFAELGCQVCPPLSSKQASAVASEPAPEAAASPPPPTCYARFEARCHECSGMNQASPELKSCQCLCASKHQTYFAAPSMGGFPCDRACRGHTIPLM